MFLIYHGSLKGTIKRPVVPTNSRLVLSLLTTGKFNPLKVALVATDET
tara:strand:+ start:377 stop:520 length:144 start_codon:yes stop_codon:yes gene_type:complete